MKEINIIGSLLLVVILFIVGAVYAFNHQPFEALVLVTLASIYLNVVKIE